MRSILTKELLTTSINPNQEYSPIHKLSGGEKRRLFLLQVLMAAPNVLILDEPTNDLDVQTLSVLEDYLEGFNGCVISVSHDRYFLDRTVQFIFALEPGGNLRLYPGNYSVYLDTKKADQKSAKEKNNKSKQLEPKAKKTESNTSDQTANGSKSKKASSLSNFERREYEKLETKVADLETEKEKLEKSLANNAADYEQVQTLSDRLSNLNQELDQATERWLELAERDA